jgi:N-acetylglucosaminyldiphosphoundecaprenol N-acetyl-beta-D-mannosaminyltransferase
MAERVAGSDLIPLLARRAAECGYSIYLLGAAPGVAASAADVLKEQYPGLKIAGVSSPPFSSVLDMDPAVLDDIRAAKPDILLVAFGNPKQEKWIGMHRRDLSVPVMIGVGATLDFIAGHRKRAPRWMQVAGLEWLFRLLQEPRRLWRRYVVDLLAFSTFFLRQWWIMRRGFEPVTLLPVEDAIIVDNTAVLAIKGRLTIENYQPFYEIGQKALHETPNIIIDLAQAEFLDSSAIGLLIELSRQARERGGELWLAAASAEIERTLIILRLDKFFRFSPTVEQIFEEKGIRIRSRAAVHPAAGEDGSSTQSWDVVKLPRRVDALTAPEVIDNCMAVLEENPYLILDLSETVFLASAGLAALAQLNRTAEKLSGELRVVNCSKDVLKVIEMVRFDKILSIYPNIASASV